MNDSVRDILVRKPPGRQSLSMSPGLPLRLLLGGSFGRGFDCARGHHTVASSQSDARPVLADSGRKQVEADPHQCSPLGRAVRWEAPGMLPCSRLPDTAHPACPPTRWPGREIARPRIQRPGVAGVPKRPTIQRHPTDIPAAIFYHYFVEVDKLRWKFRWRYKGPRISLKEKNIS